MNTPDIEQPTPANRKKLSVTRLAVAIAFAGFSLTASAGKITSIPSASGASGFGGWNLDNIEVLLDPILAQGVVGDPTTSWFDESNGAYNFATDSDFSYVANIYDYSISGELMGKALAKNWPVGEPAGIKIVNNDFDVKEGKPTNCIMSTSYLDGHFLDEADPQQVLCSGPFQSHKRYKVAMLPSTVDGVNTESIDMVFNVEADSDTRDYQVFQKINNWTYSRLKGFTIQVGTGTGANFVPASAPAGVGVTNLSLSVPSAVWPANQLANFSTGLFGPIDPKHGRPAGYFDPKKRAGFYINEYGAGNPGDASGQTDVLTSGATLGSDYAAIPPATGAAANQFGKWLPNTM